METKVLKQQKLSSNRYHYSWESIHIPHWDWKSKRFPLWGEDMISYIVDSFALLTKPFRNVWHNLKGAAH